MRFRSASVGKVLGGFVGLFGVAAGCTSFGGDSSTPPVGSSEAGTPDVSVLPGETINIESLAITDKTVTVAQGRETTLTVKIVRGPFRDEVAISLKNLTKDFTSAPVVIPAGKDTVDIKLAAAATAPLGAGQNVRVLAQSGVASKDIEAPLLVVGAPGSLDLSYGDKGVYRGPEADVEQVYDAALLPDDSVIVAGRDKLGMFLRKITKDGKPDTSYGVDGKFQPTFNTPNDTRPFYEPFALVSMGDGRILLSYRRFVPGIISTGLAVITADGKTLQDKILPYNLFENVWSISKISGNRYLLVGMRDKSKGFGEGYGGGFAALAVDGQGLIDASWGGQHGYNPTGLPAVPGALQASWSYVGVGGGGYGAMAGTSSLWILGPQFSVSTHQGLGFAKVDSSGKIDPTYGLNGQTWYSVFQVPLGFVATGPDAFLCASTESTGFALHRFADGKQDTAFATKVVGVSGLPYTLQNTVDSVVFGANRRHGVASDGNGVLMASEAYGANDVVSIVVARATNSGVSDPSFGESGIARVELPSERVSVARVFVQSSGRPIVIGDSGTPQFDVTRGGVVIRALWPSLQR